MSSTTKTTTYKTLVDRFTEELNKEGEHFYSTGNYKQDYEHITGVLKLQSYWSGAYNRYYFSDELYLVNVTPRVFGGVAQ